MGDEACDRTYGLVLWAARFSSGGRSEIDVCDNCADNSASRFEAAEGPCSWDFIIVSACVSVVPVHEEFRFVVLCST